MHFPHLLLLVPLYTSVIASTAEIPDTSEQENVFRTNVVNTKCYESVPKDIPAFEFDLSSTSPEVHEAMNILQSNNDLSLLENALAEGVDFNVPFLLDQLPIHFSILSDRKEMFDLLVGNVNVNQAGVDGLTPLHYALLKGNVYYIENLLKNGADPHQKALLEWDDGVVVEGRSFVEQSFYMQNITDEFINFMMSNFANYWSSYNVIYKKAIAARNEALMIEVAKRLPVNGSNADILELYCDADEFPSVKDYLLSTDSEIEQKCRDFVEDSNIFDACKSNNLLAVKIFVLIMEVDIDASDRIGNTALHLASARGHKEVVDFLVSKGCDIDAKEEDGLTALHLASAHGHKDVVEFLVTKGWDISATTLYGWTALHYASTNGHKEVVEFLVTKGWDIDAKANDGWTALHLASENGHKEVVDFLVSKGCDIDATTLYGFTALHLASARGHKEVVDFLVSNGCDIDAKETYGWTALHYASTNGHKEVVDFLVSKGCDIDAKEEDGLTALHLASENGHEEVVEFLNSQLK